MELLKLKENKPNGDWKGHRYFKDMVLVWFDTKNGKRNQVLVNQEAKLCERFEYVKNNILKLRAERKKQIKNNTALTVIWSNKLTAAISFWKQFGEFEEVWQERKQAREKSLWCLRNEEFEIRNFDLICNTDDMDKLKSSYDFKSNSEVGTMKAFLDMRKEQGLDNWVKINYSFSYCELKAFYKDLTKEDVPQDHWSMIPNLSVYKDIQNGIMHGVLVNHAGLERLWWKNCIEGWDLSSAYPSKLVNTKMPMGKFERVEDMYPGVLRDLMAAGRYFYVRMNFNKCLNENDCPIFNGADGEEYGGRWYYTLTNFDLQAMKEWGFDMDKTDAKTTIIRVAEYEDYIWKPVREKIYERWVEKQENKGKDENKYFRAKTAIDAIWGKSVQEFNPTDNKRIAQRFSKIEHFLLPQWGLWTCAAVRLDMIRAIIALDKDEFIAGDTDGIKVRGDKRELFERFNKEIIDKNAAAGFPSEIGIWKFEGRFEDYMFIKSKFYAYSLNGELTCKFAGCNTWKEFFKDYSLDKVFEFLEEKDMPFYNIGVLILPDGMIKAKLRREDNEFSIG